MEGYNVINTNFTGMIGNTILSYQQNSEYYIEKIVSLDEFDDRIEITYIEKSNKIYTTYPSIQPERRVFKIIYSCVDGKFNKSNKIYGEIIPATEEYYKFN